MPSLGRDGTRRSRSPVRAGARGRGCATGSPTTARASAKRARRPGRLPARNGPQRASADSGRGPSARPLVPGHTSVLETSPDVGLRAACVCFLTTRRSRAVAPRTAGRQSLRRARSGSLTWKACRPPLSSCIVQHGGRRPLVTLDVCLVCIRMGRGHKPCTLSESSCEDRAAE